MSMNKIAYDIFRDKYAVREDETWEEASVRVAHYVAQAEDEESRLEWIAKFSQIILDQVFIPGGRILANAGTGIKNLMNCFVLPVDDSRKGIYETLKNSAEVFAWGGGVGYSFSDIREQNSLIESTGGHASGPLSFMELFDLTGEVIKQASRRGAQMGMLDVSHPDIIAFIENKKRLSRKNARILDEISTAMDFNTATAMIDDIGFAPSKGSEDSRKLTEWRRIKKVLLDNQLTHFNLSVVISDRFMQAVENGDKWELVSPLNGEVKSTHDARDIFKLMINSAWSTGDPGVYFKDRAEEDNMVSYVNELSATNPCGEVPLLPYESCCLGSLNLPKFYDESTNNLDLEFLEYAVRTSVRFLDDVQDISEAPIEDINIVSKSLRKLGLGVMGWADLLALMDIPYDSDDAFELAEFLSWYISFFAWSESMKLAEEKGVFDWFDWNEVNQEVLYKVFEGNVEMIPSEVRDKVRDEVYEVRNSSVTSIAPTGTIAIIAGVNSSIEPFYSLAYRRNITHGVGNKSLETVTIFNPILNRKLSKLNITNEQLRIVEDALIDEGSIQHLEFLPQEFRDVFKTAHEIHWKDHIKAQASWQKYVSNAVSKTINLPHSISKSEIGNVYLEMWKAGLKGGTIYRDKSRTFQVLESV